MWPFRRKPVRPSCSVCGKNPAVAMHMCILCAYVHVFAPPTAVPVSKEQPEPVAVDTEIIAWRAWALTEDDWLKPVLKSPQQPMIWHGPVARADVVPSRLTTHGLYARKERNALAVYLSNPVIGTVALSGIVVEGDTGYRAEVATVRSLIVSREALAGRYCLMEACGYLAERYEVEPSIEEWPTHTFVINGSLGSSGMGSGLNSQQSALQQQYQNYINQVMQNAFGQAQQPGAGNRI